MKAKVLNVEKRTSKKDKPYQKLLLQFDNGVVGFMFDFNCVGVVGGTVELTVDTDYGNFCRLAIK